MHCSCSGPTLLWKLQRLTGLQKLSLISKSGLSAYNDHVQNTSDTCGIFPEHDLPCYTCGTNPSRPLTAAVHTSCHSIPVASSPRNSLPRLQLTTFASQHGSDVQPHQRSQHSVAATKASPAFAKTANLFKEDMAYALEHAHPASPRINAQPASRLSQTPSHSAESSSSSSSAPSHASTPVSPVASRASSVQSATSMADSASSYHGYAGVNYHAGIKDIDAVPNNWGLSLNDYKAVLGSNYVHGCVPWEDQHVDKHNQKQFQKLHTKRVQLLQELHVVERDMRSIMN